MLQLFMLLSSISFKLKGERFVDLAAEEEEASSVAGTREEGEDVADIEIKLPQPLTVQYRLGSLYGSPTFSNCIFQILA